MENNFYSERSGNILTITIVQQLISLVGILLNSTLVIVIVRHKNLHQTYSFLLAICSFSDAMFESSAFLTTILVLSCKQIPLLTCFWAQVHATFGSTLSLLCMFLIAVDRLLGVAFPIVYQYTVSKHSKKYLALILFISFLICIWIVYYSYTTTLTNPNLTVFCFIAESYNNVSVTFSLTFYFGLEFATVAIYLLIWVLLIVNNTQHQQREQTRKAFKSLAVILAIIICCYIFAVIAGIFLASALNQLFLALTLAPQLTLVGTAINLPVLYICSSEYREALQNEYKSFMSSFFGIRQQQQSWAAVSRSRIQPLNSLAPINTTS